MTKPIDVRDLESELNNTNIKNTSDFKEVAKKYFTPQYNKDDLVAFQIKPEFELMGPITGQGNSLTAYTSGGIGWEETDRLNHHLRINRRKSYLKKKKEGVPRIVAEGDSWFGHPLVRDIIDCIEDNPNFALLSLANAGDKLKKMVDEAEYLSAVISEKPKYFLLSAGGVDLLKDIRPFLKIPGNDELDNPDAYLSQKYYKLLDDLKTWFEMICRNVLNVEEPPQSILIHTYDFPIPCPLLEDPYKPNPSKDFRGGGWIGTKMRQMGITDSVRMQNIINTMLNKHADMLMALAADTEWEQKVQIVDFRGTMTKWDQWYDEIHPDDKSSVTLAEILIAKMA